LSQDRIKEVGAERTCSEWLLRVGAKVRYKGYEDFKEDFNLLPTSNFEKFQLEEIDFTNTVAMTHGFAHLSKL
jgi:H+-transporting ATP synthase F0 complex subunit s